jgi:hypothetical protein
VISSLLADSNLEETTDGICQLFELVFSKDTVTVCTYRACQNWASIKEVPKISFTDYTMNCSKDICLIRLSAATTK